MTPGNCQIDDGFHPHWLLCGQMWQFIEGKRSLKCVKTRNMCKTLIPTFLASDQIDFMSLKLKG